MYNKTITTLIKLRMKGNFKKFDEEYVKKFKVTHVLLKYGGKIQSLRIMQEILFSSLVFSIELNILASRIRKEK